MEPTWRRTDTFSDGSQRWSCSVCGFSNRYEMSYHPRHYCPEGVSVKGRVMKKPLCDSWGRPLHWFLTKLSKAGRVREHGWMLALNANELVDHARALRYDVDIEYMGPAADTVTPEVL